MWLDKGMPCALCGRPYDDEPLYIITTAFLNRDHPFYHYAGNVFHLRCYRDWPDQALFAEIGRIHREVWAPWLEMDVPSTREERDAVYDEFVRRVETELGVPARGPSR